MEKSLKELIERRLTQYPEGTPEHDHYLQMKRELETKELRLHVDEDTTCLSFQ